jgi:hypothetical protein
MCFPSAASTPEIAHTATAKYSIQGGMIIELEAGLAQAN